LTNNAFKNEALLQGHCEERFCDEAISQYRWIASPSARNDRVPNRFPYPAFCVCPGPQWHATMQVLANVHISLMHF
jgi:hypothetical protein